MPEDVVLAGQAIGKAFDKDIAPNIEEIYGRAGKIINEYAELMEKNPERALANLNQYLDKVRRVNPNRAFIESIAGGPNQDWIGPILDIAASNYEQGNMETRELILRSHFDFLDNLNYTYAQNHVETLSNPYVVRDIIISNVLYWPGYAYPKQVLHKPGMIWRDYKGFMLTDLASPVLASLAILRADYPSREIKDNFYAETPDLLDGAISLAAGMAFRDAAIRTEDGSDTLAEIEEYISKYDELLHPQLRIQLVDANWLFLPGGRHVPKLANSIKLELQDGKLSVRSEP